MSDMPFAGTVDVPDRRRIPVAALSRWWKWLNRGALASIDQGLVSGSNFVLSVMLARWLTLPHYGGYSVALSIFMLVNAVHQGLLLEPMSILGASRYADCQREYVTVLRRINAAFGVAAGIVLAAAGLAAHLMHAADVANALLALAFTGPGILLFYLIRGACYLELTPGPAALSSLGYCGLVLCGVTVLNFLGGMSAAGALLWMGAAAWTGSWILGRRFSARPAYSAPELRDVWREHWRYGRWALTATPVMWIPENISYTFAGICLGLPQAGVLRAMMNFVAPALQFATSLSRLMNPYVAGKAAREGLSGARSSVARIGLMHAAMGVAYGAVLILFHKQAFHLLYGDRFTGAVDLVLWMGAVPLFYLVLYAPMIGLRSIQSPSSVFLAYSGAAVVALTMGFPLTTAFGLKGTIVSLCAANAVGAVLGVWLFVRKTRPLAGESACPAFAGSSSV